ncbi:MAG: hypothetical protein M3253_01160, partial [Chloroflexota bacterium]|nr:hypothetical protein [Chloroflexota bacterium]
MPDLESPASTLRITLGQLLAEHAFLTVEAMRTTASDGPSRAAATDALEENTVAIEAQVASVYGAPAGSSFAKLWRDHITHLLEYAAAAPSGDEAAMSAALEGLADDRVALTSFLTGANPQISPEALAEALHLHTDQLRVFLEEDHAAAFATERQAYAHMFSVGDVLAAAFIDQFPDRFQHARLAFSPSVTLWLTLGRLLGEHLILTAEAMRSGAGADTGSAAARAAVDANTADIAAAVESIYGADAGIAFRGLWDDHIRAYFAYIDALRSGDQTEQQARRDELTRYSGTFGAFMAEVNPYLDAGALDMMIGHHTQALKDQVDAYHAGDYARAYAEVRQAHAHMFDVAKVLAVAFSAQYPQVFALPDT